ncbi:hypothetical protein OGAPHI_003132 [Ogataea philodendri]|uniref:very-long-chain (3R)-3-hydroxyacyl-CoA dehydratase n=1 Tax=Ogataea philodendri TaxID=1378263 RepID=A0A9P8P8F5_9ASCO|nr:uncharacterized protein OGAPHI_003132 [Ogataea philodendri]KAH3667483.1 hypothetical protein OGAPHI_003132 [Ogataea philodendri]
MSYNNTQLYLLISDLVRSFLSACVFLRLGILFPLTGPRFLPGGIADFFLTVYTTSVLLDGFEYVTIFRHVPKTGVPRTSGRRILATVFARVFLTAALLNYPKAAKNIAFSIVILCSSVVDFFRYTYNFYKVRTYGGSVGWLTNLRRVSYTFGQPVLVASEAALIFLCLRLVETEYGYYTDYLDYDWWANKFAFITKTVVYCYGPVFYLIYKTKVASLWKNTTKSHVKTE